MHQRLATVDDGDPPPPSIARLYWIRIRRILDAIRNVTYGPIMLDHPANLLREHGVQVTAERLAVLRTVSGRPHCTADDVAEDVRAAIGAISRQTVYNALGILAEKGLIRRVRRARRVRPAGSPPLYESRVGDNHHHVICRACRKTVDIDCVVGDTPCSTVADDSGYQIDEAEVIFRGTCPACLAASAGSADDRTSTNRHFEFKTTNQRVHLKENPRVRELE